MLPGRIRLRHRFQLTPSGGGWTEIVLYTFQGGSDGAYPVGAVILDRSGNLYGTAAGGGDLACDAPYGCGAVFQLTPSGSGWTKNVIYTFHGGHDGNGTNAGLILDRSGSLYGSTGVGGSGGCGTVFMLTPSHGSWTFNTLYSFTGTNGPAATLLMDAAGNLYGTTVADGAYGHGNVFKLMRESGGWTYTSLYDFTGGSDGGNPESSVLFDVSGNLFGTTTFGGVGCTPYPGCGVVWEISPR